MTFSAAFLAEELERLEQHAAKPHRFVVAYSGGVDSTVLLQAVCQLRSGGRLKDTAIAAVHINHQLQAQSAAWQAHCRAQAEALNVDFVAIAVTVDENSGNGLEAAAREARYAALCSQLQEGDWLLSAHHREDQAETLLLNLIRGSGPRGTAGIAAARRLGPGWLVRPLLAVDGMTLRQYATAENFSWIEDPTNADRSFDRNFLRHEVMPRMATRWPDIHRRLRRSAGHASETAELLTELARADLAALGGNSARLPVTGLLALSEPRQRNLIRFALRELELSVPTAVQMQHILSDVLKARPDAEPLVRWAGGVARRYRDTLYLLSGEIADSVLAVAFDGSECRLGRGLGKLRLEPTHCPGLDPDLLQQGLRLEPRRGGEAIQPVGHAHTRKLKALLQEAGIVPWMRSRVPLVYAGDQLVAVADLWLSEGAIANPGLAIRWTGRPALH